MAGSSELLKRDLERAYRGMFAEMEGVEKMVQGTMWKRMEHHYRAGTPEVFEGVLDASMKRMQADPKEYRKEPRTRKNKVPASFTPLGACSAAVPFAAAPVQPQQSFAGPEARTWGLHAEQAVEEDVAMQTSREAMVGQATAPTEVSDQAADTALDELLDSHMEAFIDNLPPQMEFDAGLPRSGASLDLATTTDEMEVDAGVPRREASVGFADMTDDEWEKLLRPF